jgi:PAS domain S-box-containing protein
MALTTSIGFIFFGIGLIALTGPSGLLSYLAGSSVRAMLLRTFVPLGFIGVIGSDIFQHEFTKLNSAIVSGTSLVFFGVATVVVVIQAARVIGGIVESADAKRRQAEEMVRRDKEEWENTFNSVPDLIAILDCQHNILRVNRAMAERLGLTPEQCVGARCYEVVHGAQERPPEFCHNALTCEDGLEHVFEVHEPRLGGDFIVSATPKFDDQGQIIGTVHVARDITERKQADKEREKLISELQDALAKVKLLSGFLPICANCKKIRNDKGYWQQIEAYIHDHSEAEFSHSICPDCAKKLYSELFDKNPEMFDEIYPESSDK